MVGGAPASPDHESSSEDLAESGRQALMEWLTQGATAHLTSDRKVYAPEVTPQVFERILNHSGRSIRGLKA